MKSVRTTTDLGIFSHDRTWRLLVAIAIALSLFSVATARADSAKGKTFVYCSEGSPSKFNPQVADDGTTFNATRTLYNGLVEFKYGETTLEPGLAESWAISKDGLTYTFKLRKGVKFHSTPYFKPTRELNADDVLFSFNRQREKSHPYHSVGGGSYVYFESMEMGALIKDLRKVDSHTVRFTLTRRDAPFLANLAMDFANILSAEYGEQLLKAGTPEKIDYQPIGTGPFRFVRYDKDQMIRFEANPEYFQQRAKIDKLVFAITPDASVRTQKLKTGECHLITEPAPTDLAAMRLESGLKIMNGEGLNVGYLAMNTQKKPFDNALVRQAIHAALNRDAYIEAIYMGNAKKAKNPIPPTIWSYNARVKDYEYNPTQAKALLTQAGYPNGFETELWTLPVSRPYNPNGKKMGEMMQADLAKVGIRVKLVTYDWPTYLSKTKRGEHTLAQMGWTGDNGDPDNFMHVLLGCAAVESGQNLARWCDPEFDRLVNQAKETPDLRQRTRLYEKAQIGFKQKAPWVTLAHSVVHRAMAKNVEGFRIDPLGGDWFHQVDLK